MILNNFSSIIFNILFVSVNILVTIVKKWQKSESLSVFRRQVDDGRYW